MDFKGVKVSTDSAGARKTLDLRPGDTVRISQKVKEKGKTRLQVFEGLVLARKHGREAGATFTVRRVIDGIGVERIFSLYSPIINKIEITRRAKVRRAKLYHIREKAAKEIRREMRNIMKLPVTETIAETVETTEVLEEEIKEAKKE